MKIPKKPKLKSLPKRPKASAPLKTWQGYEEKCEAVRKENAQKIKEWEKAKKEVVTNAKKKEQIQKKTQGLGRI